MGSKKVVRTCPQCNRCLWSSVSYESWNPRSPPHPPLYAAINCPLSPHFFKLHICLEGHQLSLLLLLMYVSVCVYMWVCTYVCCCKRVCFINHLAANLSPLWDDNHCIEFECCCASGFYSWVPVTCRSDVTEVTALFKRPLKHCSDTRALRFRAANAFRSVWLQWRAISPLSPPYCAYSAWPSWHCGERWDLHAVVLWQAY